MITTDNLSQVLATLGFSENNDVFTKHFNNSSCEVKVDCATEIISYPKGLKIHRDTTTNFSANENFVVLECIVRLLQQGYQPQQIELEKGMPGGHDDTGGYCDILVQDNEEVPFLLIECKKADEFDRFWKRMTQDGGQLFNYYNSYRQAQALCLYTSDFVDGKVVYTSHIVSMVDNDEYLKTAKTLKGFKDMQALNAGKSAYFDVWKNTYQLDFMTKGIFEQNIQPFTIGKLKLSVGDLQEIDSASMQKKYNEFATIMRQHNVGGHENAFDKLVNLFLAKIVDESQNPDELKFYWKGVAQDNYYSFQDRLQHMYTKGMRDFLGEDVTYIDEKTIKNSFKLFVSDPDATKDTILEYFRQQKFYTNNDFAFLDVHNQELFLQNIKILIKCVQMLQDIKLKTDEENQFLGDLFEGFLDQGIKQSEGQFLTPMPIVKFLVSALPLEKMIQETPEPLKVIDYACGAGHFLNEYGHQIKPFVQNNANNDLADYYKNIYGVEKEYRLSKVAKVSAFMYGQNDINIIYADALSNNAKIENDSFSVLVANPPYSVKGFLETLTDEEREKYQLTKAVGDLNRNNSIETFFVERATQLLKTGDVAAIILPSSILSNGSIYSKCRQILLENFSIVAIAEFGPGTFGKTGTNTCTLFLRKRENNPNIAEHYQNRVNAWFNGDFKKDGVFEDSTLLEQYCLYMKYDYNDYKTLLQGKPNNNLLQTEMFKEYENTFDACSKNKKNDVKELNEKAKDIQDKIRKRVKTKQFKSLTQQEQETDILQEFIKFVIEIEKEKLYIFILAYTNGSDVLVVKSPTDTKSRKTFLGYEWSSAKGNEGIKYLNVATTEKKEEGETAEDDTIKQIKGINGIQTPLFNPQNLADENKLNTLIRKNFTNGSCQIPAELEAYASLLRLIDLLDFSRTTFNKAIKLTVDKKLEIQSTYPLVRLGDVAEIKIGGTPPRSNNSYFQGNHLWVSISEMSGNIITDTKEKLSDEGVENSNVKLIKKGTTLLSFKLSIGKTAIAGADLFTNEAIAGLIPIDEKTISNEYLFQLFNGNLIDLENVGSKAFGKSLNSTYLREEVKIPLPPPGIQQEIVTACQAVDNKYAQAQSKIAAAQSTIAECFKSLDDLANKSGTTFRLTNESVFDISIGRRILSSEVNEQNDIPVYSANVFEPFGKINSLLLTDFSKDSVLWGIDGDWMVNIIPKGLKFYPTDHCGVLRIKTDDIEPRYMVHLLEKAGKKERFSRTIRASIDRIQSLSVVVPALSEQQKIVSQVSALEAEIAAA